MINSQRPPSPPVDLRFGELKSAPMTIREIDRSWGGFVQNTQHPEQAYWDYFYSGQDVKVYIDGTEDDSQFAQLPIAQIAFNVSQQKQPLYGFWSHTFDAVMRGTRIISGSFSLATRYPNYMRNALAKAAASRALLERSYTNVRDLTEDDFNIEEYWGKTRDRAVNDNGNHLFSVHPPFSFVIVYGLQSISVGNQGIDGQREIREMYNSNTALYSDFNERLVETENDIESYRIVLEACEITDVQREITSDGSVLLETYSFFARDIIVPDSSDTGSSGTTRLPNTGKGASGADIAPQYRDSEGRVLPR